MEGHLECGMFLAVVNNGCCTGLCVSLNSYDSEVDPKTRTADLGVVAHSFIPDSGGRGRQISELEHSLVCRASSWTVRTTQRNPVLKSKQTVVTAGKYSKCMCVFWVV